MSTQLKSIENTTETKESRGSAFGLEGDLFIIPIIGVFLGIIIFSMSAFAGGDPVKFFFISLMPPSVCLLCTYAFLNNKPPHYLEDKLEKITDNGVFNFTGLIDTPNLANPKPNTNKFKDCYFAKTLIIFNEADSRGYVSKGYFIRPPSVTSLAISNLNDIQDRLSSFLSNIKAPVRCQFDWSLSTDYNEEIDRYDAETDRLCRSGTWFYRVRKQVADKYRKLQDRQVLKKERLAVYFSIQLNSDIETDKELDLLDNQLSIYGNALKGLFSYYNCDMEEMVDDDYFREYVRAFNPSLSYEARNKLDFNPLGSAMEQCISGEIIDKDSYFLMSGMYHAAISVKALPKVLYPGMASRLLALNINDYSITLNITPIDPEKERKKEEDLIQRLEGDMKANRKEQYSTNVARNKKIAKVEALAEGRINPLRCEYIIKVAASDPQKLQQSISLIKEVVAMTNGTLAWEGVSGRSSRNMFFQTMPGWMFGKYNKFSFYAENNVISCMAPFSSSFSGNLNTAEALYDGSDRNMIGVVTFTGGTPQHSMLLGTTGCGKSAFLIDLLSQTGPYYDYTCIIEEGLSYYFYSLTQGEKPLIIHPDSSITFNYFDLGGLPLSASHISFCSNLLMNMMGYTGDADKDNFREAMLGRYVQMLYSEVYETWTKDNPGKVAEVARRCIAAEKAMTLENFFDSYVEIEKRIALGDEKILKVLSEIKEDEITRYLLSPNSAQRVEQAAFTLIPQSDLPDHSKFMDFITTNTLPEHGQEEINRIITSLEAWSRTGAYGAIFDGETNVKFTGKHIHFELGSIPESAGNLKKMVAVLIMNIVRQHIIKLPRHVRKRVVFEEIAKFLQISGAGKIVEECYAQFRKYSAWVITVNQNYGLFKNSPIKNTVMSNSKQHFIMRQNDANDIEDFMQSVPLPESLSRSVLAFPLPETLPPGQKYSSFLYNYSDRNMYSGGIGHNIASKEMLLCASTSGESFEKAKTLFSDGIADGKDVMKVFDLVK